MTRRGFLQRLGAAAIGLTLARTLPGIAAAPPTLKFDPSAFGQIGTGTSIRFVRSYDAVLSECVSRLDVFYGSGVIKGPIQAWN